MDEREPVRPDEDEAGPEWERGVAREWAEDLTDRRQDIYTWDDGEPLGERKQRSELLDLPAIRGPGQCAGSGTPTADAAGVPNQDFAIEDLFPVDFYTGLVEEVYAKQLAAAGVPKAGSHRH